MSGFKPDIIIIGSGNVGYHLGIRLHQAGYTIKQVFSRTNTHGRSLAEKVSSGFTNDISEIVDDADVYLLCVKDDAMKDVVDALRINGKIVLHTAGTVACKISNRTDIHQGVLYPLQSFSRNAAVSWENVPVFVDGENEIVVNTATGIAKDLSGNVQLANDKQRMLIHIAAVFANNFSNHCIAIGQKLLEENSYDFNVLKPLINTTFMRLQATKPFDVQTGPAIRKDEHTIEKHLDALEQHSDWKKIYQYLSDNIKTLHNS